MSTTIWQRSGTLLSASPPWMRPRLTDGRSNSSEDSRENGRDSIRRKTSIAFRTALSPSHGVEPWAERPWTCRRKASTPLAWTPTCRSVGSPVIAKSPREPAADDVVDRARVDVLGLLVGHADEAHADLVLLGQVAQRAHHRGDAALHVIGAAAVQPVALDPRRELLHVARDDVEVPVEDDRRRVERSDAGGEDRQAAEDAVVDVDLAGLQPALDEARARADAVRLRRVVRDQPLGQGALVHRGKGSRARGEAGRGRAAQRLVQTTVKRSAFDGAALPAASTAETRSL